MDIQQSCFNRRSFRQLWVHARERMGQTQSQARITREEESNMMRAITEGSIADAHKLLQVRARVRCCTAARYVWSALALLLVP